MIDFVKKGAMMLCLAGTALIGLPSCNDEDPNYENGILPEIELPPHVLTGVISGRDGSLLAGATVKMGDLTATTDEQGVYIFEDVQPGEYELQAESEGRRPVSGKVVVKDVPKLHSVMWNAVLTKDIKDEVMVSQTEDQIISLSTESAASNQDASLQVQAFVPANVVSASDDAKITFVSLYNEDQTNSRAVSSELMIGTEVSCNIPDVQLSESILLRYRLGKDLCDFAEPKMCINGKWKTVEYTIEDDTLIIKVTKPGRYGVFYRLDYTIREDVEPIQFKQSVWDNLYGAKPIRVRNVGYTYKMGSEIIVEGDTEITEDLADFINNVFDLVDVQTVNRRYPINQVVKVGFKLEISGYQDVIIKKISKGNMSAVIKEYGEVHIGYKFYNREHMGGSN